jgi:hypothetical protein
MTVGELMKELSRLDPEATVVCYTEDPGSRYSVLEIDEVSQAMAEASRRGNDARG